MRIELSTLFHLGGLAEIPVNRAHIGGGVLIEELQANWIRGVKTQCPKVAARETLEFVPFYTHRMYVGLDAEERNLDERFEEIKQLLFRAVILSRIVKPTSISYSNVWVKSFYNDTGAVEHEGNFQVNGMSVSYVARGDEGNTITQADASRMASLWDSLQYILDDNNERRFRRVVRAIKFFEFAHPIYFAGVRHLPFHAALESLIYCGPKENKAQIKKRLPLLLTTVTEQQAEQIYELHGYFKHEAQALQQEPEIDGELAPSDQRRLDTVNLLERCVRELLLKALSDLTLAEILSDCTLLRQHYGVTTRQGIM